MHISFDSIGQQVATFLAAEDAAEGQVCKLTANGTVGACTAGDRFCGVIHHLEDGVAAVILRGYVTLPYTGSDPAVGFGKLAAGEGGAAATGETGGEYLIVDVDTETHTVGLFL